MPVHETCSECSILGPDSTGAVYRRKFGSGLLLSTVFSLPGLLTFRARQAGAGASLPQGRCHGFNVGEGKDRLYRFMRNFENVPFWGKDIQLEQSTGASLGGRPCYQSVFSLPGVLTFRAIMLGGGTLGFARASLWRI